MSKSPLLDLTLDIPTAMYACDPRHTRDPVAIWDLIGTDLGGPQVLLGPVGDVQDAGLAALGPALLGVRGTTLTRAALLAARARVCLEVVRAKEQAETRGTRFLVGTRVDALVSAEAVVGRITLAAVGALEPLS